MENMTDDKVLAAFLDAQKNEITEHFIYAKLARVVKDDNNRQVLERIGEEEKAHYEFFKRYTNRDVAPSWFRVWLYYFIARLFGLTFGIKLMENGEGKAQENYKQMARIVPEISKIEEDEDRHERQLIGMINEERLEYVGSMVLGLNDALVELTGALAGLSFALQNTKLTAIAGLITGIAASLSMAASEYLSVKAEEGKGGKNPLKASVYTGIAYIFTVCFLIFPFLICLSSSVALVWTMLNALIVIFIFTFYISVAKDLSFKLRFLEMAVLSFAVAGITFLIGIAIRHFLHIDV